MEVFEIKNEKRKKKNTEELLRTERLDWGRIV